MQKLLATLGSTVFLTFIAVETSYAVDSYRYVHVSIDTIWWIFLGLLTVVLSPIILMGALVWHSAKRKASLQEPAPEFVKKSEE
jgi:hypothetical protein